MPKLDWSRTGNTNSRVKVAIATHATRSNVNSRGLPKFSRSVGNGSDCTTVAGARNISRVTLHEAVEISKHSITAFKGQKRVNHSLFKVLDQRRPGFSFHPPTCRPNLWLSTGLRCAHVSCTLRIVNSSSGNKNKKEKKRSDRSWSVMTNLRHEVAYKVTRDFTVKSPLLEAFGPAPAGLSNLLSFSLPLLPFPAPRVTLPPWYSARSRFNSVVVSPPLPLFLPYPSFLTFSRVRRFFSIIYLPTSAQAPFTSSQAHLVPALVSAKRGTYTRRYLWICRAFRTRRA